MEKRIHAESGKRVLRGKGVLGQMVKCLEFRLGLVDKEEALKTYLSLNLSLALSCCSRYPPLTGIITFLLLNCVYSLEFQNPGVSVQVLHLELNDLGAKYLL